MLMELADGFRSLHAPKEDGQKLIDPLWPELPEIVADSRKRIAKTECDVQGRVLSELAASARRAIVAQAAAYTSRYRDVPAHLRDVQPIGSAPIILSGHQPQLFHPGVWYKNFVLGGLARRLDGVGIHLLIDSDLCRSVSIRVPVGTADQPRVETVPFDQPAAEMPYEERAIRDPSTLASFAERVAALIKPLVREPMIETMWPLVLQRGPAQTILGLRLAQGRHAYEQSWHNNTLELPQSAVCQLTEFAWFAAHILAHLPRFWSAHNDALAAYRDAHRMRNRAQPVPDLTEVDGWLEAPFWIWSRDDPQRRPLFARQSADEITISDRRRRMFRLSVNAERGAASAVEQLLEFATRGIKIRTRALATTLFARLVLSDLFLHGIGGAKYDQVTDQIARQFFGFELPEFATVSATLRLPIAHEPMNALHDGDLLRQAREMRFHPERYVHLNRRIPIDKRSIVEEIMATKLRWVRTLKTPENARERHLAIAAANNELQPFLDDLHREIDRQREELALRKRANVIVESREYSFCLYPRWHFDRLLLDDPPLAP